MLDDRERGVRTARAPKTRTWPRRATTSTQLRRTRASPRAVTQPERHVRRLHRVGDHRLEVAAQAVEVDLLPQPRAERLERALRVVAAAVEAPVDEPLHPRAQRQEQRGDDERRRGDRQVRAAGERREHAPGRRARARRTRRRGRPSASRRRASARSRGRSRRGGSAGSRSPTATGMSISAAKPVMKIDPASEPSSTTGLTKESANAVTGTAPAKASHFICCRSIAARAAEAHDERGHRRRRSTTARAARRPRRRRPDPTRPDPPPGAGTAHRSIERRARVERLASTRLERRPRAVIQSTQRQRPASGAVREELRDERRSDEHGGDEDPVRRPTAAQCSRPRQRLAAAARGRRSRTPRRPPPAARPSRGRSSRSRCAASARATSSPSGEEQRRRAAEPDEQHRPRAVARRVGRGATPRRERHVAAPAIEHDRERDEERQATSLLVRAAHARDSPCGRT